ncbi:histidine phosphotransferase family protein [Gymnodinialimonas ceratoperidinii]|uniref:Histidine phosphotransferase n=1 Tax=Gymnodinialimonas ceratoperidinii TaxID=2856823 RepID=A0A8F6TT41_9RHOB|nr:histidine phosphotransferase family protein [Gymnodinialimonas ceratoperidinii]QXT38457.1 histidine phosphotransferase [Gymnodinialimonas ceratoperidinii]
MRDQKNDPVSGLADLVASRLCHDLVNPLGAIGNGVELLEMTGKADGPEVELIRDAVRAGEARIRMFRLAFGGADPSQITSLREATTVVDGYFKQSRIAAVWMADGDRSRQETKMALLMLLCAEAALPMGGSLRIGPDPSGNWQLEATGPRLNIDENLWELLRSGAAREGRVLRPSDAQFPVLLRAAQALGSTVNYFAEAESFRMSTS